MKPNRMIAGIMAAFDTDEQSVKMTVTTLRRAGKLSLSPANGPRGVNAPDLTARDLASVLLAHMVHIEPGYKAVHSVEKFGGLICKTHFPEHPFSLESLRGLSPPFTFLDALAALIEILAFEREKEPYVLCEKRMRDGTREPPSISVAVSDAKYPQAKIEMGPLDDLRTGVYAFEGRKLTFEEAREADWRFTPHIHRDAWVTQALLLPLADVFAGRDG